jgi:serine/threonine-protein kinase RsbW
VPVSWCGPGSQDADVWVSLGLPVTSTGTGRWVLDPPAAEPPEYPPAVAAARALVTLRLAVDSWNIGQLCLGYHAPRRFSPGDRAFLTAFANQCAQAFERVRLYRERTQRAERSAFLARLGTALDEAPGIAQRARRLVDLVVPELASWASVDVATAGGSRRIAEAPVGDLVEQLPAAGRRVGPDEVARATATAVATGKVQWVEGPHPDGGDAPDGGSGAGGADRVPDRVAVALPLHARGSPLGAVTLIAPPTGPFVPTDLPFLDDLGYRAGLAFENARLYEHERDTAHVLQQSLLTGEPPADPRIEIATWYVPGTEDLEVGGDWHDAFPVSDGTIGVVVGDVVGRGINAASTMGQLRSATRALAGARLGPARLLEHLDRFVDRLDAGRMATLVYAEIRLDTGVMRYACAGHPPPILIGQTGDAQLLWEGRSLPLGVLGGVPRTDAEVTLRPGVRLLLYTDGLVETRTTPVTDGMTQVADKLSQHREASPGALLRILTDHMLRGRNGDDDICLLCISFKGAG